MYGQDNFKKCTTTKLFEEELLINSDYLKGRATAIAENITFI